VRRVNSPAAAISVRAGRLWIAGESFPVEPLFSPALAGGETARIDLRLPRRAANLIWEGLRGRVNVWVTISGDGKTVTDRLAMVLKRAGGSK
jgi:hypothetical protein